VVAAITPFNAPANLLVQKLAPALATGNAMVVKPHPTGIEVALAFAELAKQAGLPDGLFNVVTGDRSAALELVAHPLTSVITLTGGVAAARALSAAAGPKKFCAELGSNAANLVLADANLDDAATKIAAAGFEASGQQCISAQRVIVEQPVFEAFVEKFVAAAKKLKVGDPTDPTTDVGTMVSVAAAQRVMSMVTDAEAKGARIALKPTMDGALLSPAIIVATEAGMLHRLEKECPGKTFIPAPTENCRCNECRFMKMNTLEKLRDCMQNLSPRLELPQHILDRGRAPIERMLQISALPEDNAG
jgi:acyl-CoA reductase-like NAD-dependent aldehyde dehydrogenase